MDNPSTISIIMAFWAGLLVFLSPCILPLIPTYISYLTGVSYNDLVHSMTKEERDKVRVSAILHSVMFSIGFSIVFVILGTTVSYLGKTFLENQYILKKVSGVVIIIFGLMITGIFKIGFLEKERKISYHRNTINYLGSVIIGATFAFAWTPCVGPILGSILAYASSTESAAKGAWLLTFFSIGLAIPFILSAVFLNFFIFYFHKIKKIIGLINIAGGIVLIIFGILILTGRLI